VDEFIVERGEEALGDGMSQQSLLEPIERAMSASRAACPNARLTYWLAPPAVDKRASRSTPGRVPQAL
jgi:hypothetical protein